LIPDDPASQKGSYQASFHEVITKPKITAAGRALYQRGLTSEVCADYIT